MNWPAFLAINSALNGHLLVVWAMGLNAFAWQYGEKFGPWGVLAGALALTAAHMISDVESLKKRGPALCAASTTFTLASWLLWLLPAVLR